MTPDYPAAITGWRFWKIRRTPRDGNLWLKSAVRNNLWPPGEKFDSGAPLSGQSEETGMLPEPGSKSGIYAYKTPEHALDNIIHFWCRGTFLGAVRLWGIIQRHEFGYRAQYAYPASLSLGICCVCMKTVYLGLEPFAIGWASLHITEDFSVNGLLCARCNEKYYSLDTETGRMELKELSDRYGIGIE